MAFLVSTNGFKCLVDDNLMDFLSRWKWGFDGRYFCRHQYGENTRIKIYLHRLINQTPEGLDTDHINGDKLDCRMANLRTSTRSQNEINKPKKRETSSQYRGVCWFKLRGKWKAEIKRNGIKKHLGLFISEEEAAHAFDNAARESGNFAKLNFN